MIWLFMNGGVSHMESFDPKPMLNKYGGKTIAETPFADVRIPKKLAIERLVVSRRQRQSAQHALSAADRLSKVRPERHRGERLVSRTSARHVDRLAIVRSMWTTDSNHGAQTQFHSGRHMNDGEFPTLGAWVHYGLGSLNENLPQFISIGARDYWNTRDGLYLGPAHDAVPLRIDPKNPLDFCTPEREFSADSAGGRDRPDSATECDQRRSIIRRIGACAARIASYELAYPHADVGAGSYRFLEGDRRRRRSSTASTSPHSREFGEQLLASRRFVERGVRFIQIQHGGGGAGAWDAHSESQGRPRDVGLMGRSADRRAARRPRLRAACSTRR